MTTDPDHFEENLAVPDFELSEAEVDTSGISHLDHGDDSTTPSERR